MTDPADDLAKWRVRNELSQEAAGKALGRHLPHTPKGVTQGTWAAWENKRKRPDSMNSFAIEKLTGGAIKAERWPLPRRKQRKPVRRKAA